MRRGLIAGLLLLVLLGMTASAQAGDLRFSFGFGFGFGHGGGYYRPIYVFRPYAYPPFYTPYSFGYAGYSPYAYAYPRYYYRPYYPPVRARYFVPYRSYRSRPVFRDRGYVPYTPRRYGRVW